MCQTPVNNKRSRVVAVKNNKIIDIDINEALKMPKDFDYDLYDVAQQVSL